MIDPICLPPLDLILLARCIYEQVFVSSALAALPVKSNTDYVCLILNVRKYLQSVKQISFPANFSNF